MLLVKKEAAMESIWSRTYSLRKKDALHSDVAADAAVIGGGMAGILTAYQLERAGMRTVVLEAAHRERADKGDHRQDYFSAWNVLSFIYRKEGNRYRGKICAGQSGGSRRIQKDCTAGKD